MADSILDALGPVLTRWTMGASALSSAPGDWRGALGNDPVEGELRLLALSGQFLGVTVVTEPEGALRALPDLPDLALPCIPAALRPLAQRAMAAAQGQMRSLFPHFLAARGWVMHPADWMPSANDDDAPEVYAPWRDWAVATTSGEVRARPVDALDANNWDDHWPAERRTALAELRARDPAGARALLEAKLAGESADARLRLVEVMAGSLSEADVPFLETVSASDRAPKVKALAASLLARLGHGGGGEDVAELAGFFTVQTKGLLRRTRVVQFLNQKTPAQAQRRLALFEAVDLGAFAAALGFDDEALFDAWPWRTDHRADRALLTMMARSGPDALIARAVDSAARRDGIGAAGATILAPRLAPGARARAAVQLLQSGQAHFGMALEISRGAARIDDPLATPVGLQWLAALAKPDAKSSEGADQLFALGLLASRTGARRALDRLTAAGLLQADPRLDMIRLNAALDDKGGME